jgi:hypothetical protein
MSNANASKVLGSTSYRNTYYNSLGVSNALMIFVRMTLAITIPVRLKYLPMPRELSSTPKQPTTSCKITHKKFYQRLPSPISLQLGSLTPLQKFLSLRNTRTARYVPVAPNKILFL